MTRPCVLIDTREQRPLRFSCRVSTERATLDAGDYSVSGAESVCRIERKSLEDLARCCWIDRERFIASPDSQMRRIRRFRWRWLVIEATREAIRSHAYLSKLPPERIFAVLDAIEVGGIPVHHFVDATECATWVERTLCRVLAAVKTTPGTPPAETEETPHAQKIA